MRNLPFQLRFHSVGLPTMNREWQRVLGRVVVQHLFDAARWVHEPFRGHLDETLCANTVQAQGLEEAFEVRLQGGGEDLRRGVAGEEFLEERPGDRAPGAVEKGGGDEEMKLGQSTTVAWMKGKLEGTNGIIMEFFLHQPETFSSKWWPGSDADALGGAF